MEPTPATSSRKKQVATRGRAWTDEETELLVLSLEKAVNTIPSTTGTSGNSATAKAFISQVHALYQLDVYQLAVTEWRAQGKPVKPFEEFIVRDVSAPDGGLQVTDPRFQPRSARSVEDKLGSLKQTYQHIKDHDTDGSDGQISWFQRPVAYRTAALAKARRIAMSEKVYHLLDRILSKPQPPAAGRVTTRSDTANGSVAPTVGGQKRTPSVALPTRPSKKASIVNANANNAAAAVGQSPTLASSDLPLPRHAAAVWVDNANITRTRVVPTRRVLSDPQFCVKLTTTTQACTSMADAPLGSPVGEVYLVPETPQKLHRIGRWMEDAGAFFGDMTRDTTGESEWPYCPRSFLRRQVARLRDQYKLFPTVGFELEFQLLDQATQTPIDAALYCSMKAFHDGRAWKLLKDIVECLEDDLDIPVHQYHAESARGQLEISIGTFGTTEEDGEMNSSIVRAVDKLVLVRQTIYAMAAQRGLQATFVPKLQVGQAGNAAHVHVGLRDVATRGNLFETNVKSAGQFVAGILYELPGLCMLLAPTVNSYDRLQPKCWAGAYQCFGYENREAPLRLVGPTAARDDMSLVDHFEVKTLDGTANPYLALGTILAAGMSGLDRELTLPLPCTQDPATMAPHRPALLPRSLHDAIEIFQLRRDALWNSVLSEPYATLLVALRTAELAHYSALDQRGQVTELLKRY